MRLVAFLGDGIGPEIVGCALTVLTRLDELFGLGLQVEVRAAGLTAIAEHGSTFPAESRHAAREADGIILGPLSTQSYAELGESGVNASAWLRTELDLFANVRPARSRAAIQCPNPRLDTVIVRENIEGFYAVRTMHAGCGEFAPDPDTAFALRKITARASRRIAETAFALALRQGRRTVTAVHKSNVLKVTDSLFLRECRAVADSTPGIGYEEVLVDAMASALIGSAPPDVIVTTNLFGDILSNLAAEAAGGLGLAGSLNHGAEHAMAQAAHGSAPTLAGQDVANPISLVASVAMLLRWLGERHGKPSLVQASERLTTVIDETLSDPGSRTGDVGGGARTSAVKAALLSKLEDGPSC